jgi:hypothetical protein
MAVAKLLRDDNDFFHSGVHGEQLWRLLMASVYTDNCCLTLISSLFIEVYCMSQS